MVVILILPSSSEQTPPPSSSIIGCDQFPLNGARIINNNHHVYRNRNRTTAPKRIRFQTNPISHYSSATAAATAPDTGAYTTTTATATTTTTTATTSKTSFVMWLVLIYPIFIHRSKSMVMPNQLPRKVSPFIISSFFTSHDFPNGMAFDCFHQWCSN